MLMSGGRLVLGDQNPSSGPNVYAPPSGLSLARLFADYGQMYKRQNWVYVVVRKRALATRRLPLKVYRRGPKGRIEERDHPLAVLLRQPNERLSGAELWEWTSSTFDIFGEAFWIKLRNRDGVPVKLQPAHPSHVEVRSTEDGSYEYVVGRGVIAGGKPDFIVPERDMVHFRSYNPSTIVRGLSPLEPLRQTLMNEDAAARASAAFWRNGGRPSGYLSHPAKLSQEAIDRLRATWSESHEGVDNYGRWAILEEGLEPKTLDMTAKDSQYVESRKLHREEVCATYDVPPPVVHILDRATFSNIVEQMRSMYRDTMAPVLSGFEMVLARQLIPDFGADLYSEFLMDEVLRGDFEQRVDAYQKGINSGWLTVNEVRRMENLDAVAGGDTPLVNGALVPLDAAGSLVMSAKSLDSFWGRLGRVESLDDINPAELTAGLNGHTDAVLTALTESQSLGESVAEFRARVRDVLHS